MASNSALLSASAPLLIIFSLGLSSTAQSLILNLISRSAPTAQDTSHKYSATLAEKDAARLNNQETITTFEHLAGSTGGKACVERTDLSGCFKDAIDDSRDYYMVGFYVDSSLKPGWHKLQVKVAADANVRSRTGFIYSKLDIHILGYPRKKRNEITAQ